MHDGDEFEHNGTKYNRILAIGAIGNTDGRHLISISVFNDGMDTVDGQHGHVLAKPCDLHLVRRTHELMPSYHILAFSPGLATGTGFFRLTGVLGKLADSVSHLLSYMSDANAPGRNLTNPIIDDKWNDMNNAYIDRTRAKRMSKLAYEKKPYDELMAFTDGILKS